MHFDEVRGFQQVSGDWVSLVLFDERHDVDDVEYVALGSADWVFERSKRETAAVERKFFEGKLFLVFFALPVLLHFGVSYVHFVFGVSVLRHCSTCLYKSLSN